jgi:chaperonin GroES
MLPVSAQRLPTSGDVVSVGDGRVPGSDTPRPLELAAGDTILYSKFGLGCTDLKLGGEIHILLRASDVIGAMPRPGARAEDIPDLRPLGDRVLLRVQEAASVTAGGVVLPDSAKERPMAGEVVRTGPGKWDEDAGERVAPKVQAGDRVLYFKYAGDAMETPTGEKFVVLHESDILCKT